LTQLIVMRLADMHRGHPAQDNSKTCSKCNRQVGIYPSGQKVLLAQPSVEIVCNVCAEAARDSFDVAMSAPGALAEPAESVPIKEVWKPL
jgi:hypothetical protein